MSTSLSPALMQRLPRWIDVALVILLGFSAAWLVLKFLPNGNLTGISSQPLPVSGGNATAPDALATARDLASKHLFGDAAKPVEKPVETKAAPVETRLNLQLAGVFAYEPQEFAMAIISAGSGEQLAYGIGDKITGEATLKAVYSDYVVIDNRGREEIIRLPENVQPIAVAQPSASRSSVEPSPSGADVGGNGQDASVELPATPGALRDMLVRQPALLGRIVAAEPYQENGKLLGYKITPKQNPEILEAQGILAGDVLTRVNNIELNSQRQGIRALRNAVKAETLDVTILRDGVEIPVNISLAQ